MEGTRRLRLRLWLEIDRRGASSTSSYSHGRWLQIGYDLSREIYIMGMVPFRVVALSVEAQLLLKSSKSILVFGV
jgi:hypothetical protein